MSECAPPLFIPPGTPIETINDILLEQPEHLAPEFPAPQEPWYRREPESAEILNTEELVRSITAENNALREKAEADGMKQPCLSIFAGNMFGGAKETLLSAAAAYHKTNEIPAWFGDGMSYIKGSLLPNAAASGIAVRLFVPHEVAAHPATRKAIEEAGLRPDDVLVAGHELGGLLASIGSLLESRDWLQLQEQEEFSSSFADKEAHSLWIREQIEQIDAAIDARLAEEDEKLRDLVAQENAGTESNAIIAIMPAHTQGGDDLIRGAMTNELKDIDGMGPNPDKFWDQITSRATIRTGEYFSRLFAGRTIPAKFVAVAGLGRLVGKRVADLLNAGTKIDGTKAIQSWSAKPGKKPHGLVVLAHRGGEVMQVDQLRAARCGKRMLGFMRREKLLIVIDDGSVPKETEDGKRITVGNIDPSSIPHDRNVKIVPSRNGVGPVTGAEAAQRTIRVTIMDFYNQKPSAGTEGHTVEAPRELAYAA